MNLSQFEQAIWHRRRLDRGPTESRDHAGEIVSAIEPILELGEVSRHMLAADRTVGAGDRGFDVPKGGVDPFENGVSCRGRSAACAGRLMFTILAGAASAGIAHHDAAYPVHIAVPAARRIPAGEPSGPPACDRRQPTLALHDRRPFAPLDPRLAQRDLAAPRSRLLPSDCPRHSGTSHQPHPPRHRAGAAIDRRAFALSELLTFLVTDQRPPAFAFQRPAPGDDCGGSGFPERWLVQ